MLIKCPECGKEVSNKAKECIHCGYPISTNTSGNTEPSNTGMNVCPKCGKFIIGNINCPDCNTKMVNCHCTETEWTDMLLDGSLPNWERAMREKYVTNSKNIDKTLLFTRIQAEKTENDEWESLIATAPTSNSNIPKCPICQSTNLSKISNLKKAGKIGLFGIFGAGDVGKTWKCNNCGSKF